MVVVVVVDGDVWLLSSTIWLQHPERMEKGEKREQSNYEYSSKVLASKDLHYICIGVNEMGSICGLNCRMPEEKGESLAYQRLASSSILQHQKR